MSVKYKHSQGATHQFFGMAAVAEAARDAQAFVSLVQRQALGGAPM